MRRAGIILLVAVFCCIGTFAKGRRPDDEDKDNYPDYNRLEMHPKPKDAQPASPSEQPAVPTPRPSLNTPANVSTDEDTVPKPPPAAVPLPDNSSEPPLPDDIKDTLVPSTTNQK